MFQVAMTGEGLFFASEPRHFSLSNEMNECFPTVRDGLASSFFSNSFGEESVLVVSLAFVLACVCSCFLRSGEQGAKRNGYWRKCDFFPVWVNVYLDFSFLFFH